MKNFDKGIQAGHVADSLNPDLQNTSVNLGILNEISGNLLYAEEFYRKSIDMNSRHYLPFERLGYLYTNTTQYAQADSFFYEADIRKKGYHFKGNEWESLAVVAVMPASIGPHCDIDTSILKKDDIMAFFTWGVQDYYDKDYPNAVRILKRVIALDKKNPLVFHYLGRIFYDQQKWEDAELMFKYAIQYYQGEDAFNKYCDSIVKNAHYPYDHACFENFFRFSYYKKTEDFCFISTLYESWNHYDEAEVYYKKIIDLDPSFIEGYIKLWQMLEKLGRYEEAEKVIKSFSVYDYERTDRELNAFYRRTIQKFPDKSEWYYKLSLLLYQRAQGSSRATFFDTIVYFPVLNKEIFIDSGVYANLQHDPSLHLDESNINGSGLKIDLKEVYEQKAAVTVEGTNEVIGLADAIYTPRKDAIYYLSKSADLIIEPETVADIDFKIGNVFILSGSKKQAYPYYDKAVKLMPGNASARMKVVEVCNAIYKYRVALDHLNYLYDNKQINFPYRLLLAQYCIHAGQFEKAKKILDEAQEIHPYIVPAILDLMGRLNLLSSHWAEAMAFYQKYLAMTPGDNAALYTIARIYAQSGNKTEALKWLKTAIDKGFKYYWVLNSDTSWNKFRLLDSWKELAGKVPITTYKSNFK
ncbi:MAG TPA: tetratricopeptide repeat protein [Chitinophagaceae bacterium]|nr:tetratricopeptide repeat protein [Chitinophagaceae bacterium]